MKIANDSVVLIEYTLRDDQGVLLDQSETGAPLAYLHGHSNLIPGLERALVGSEAGSSIRATVAPEDAYGLRDERLVIKVPRDKFPPDARPEPGMQFQGRTPQGMRLMTVVGVEPSMVLLDGNHPLADKALHFEVRVVEVRPATPGELEHGHVHGPGGHHHH